MNTLMSQGKRERGESKYTGTIPLTKARSGACLHCCWLHLNTAPAGMELILPLSEARARARARASLCHCQLCQSVTHVSTEMTI